MKGTGGEYHVLWVPIIDENACRRAFQVANDDVDATRTWRGSFKMEIEDDNKPDGRCVRICFDWTVAIGGGA